MPRWWARATSARSSSRCAADPGLRKVSESRDFPGFFGFFRTIIPSVLRFVSDQNLKSMKRFFILCFVLGNLALPLCAQLPERPVASGLELEAAGPGDPSALAMRESQRLQQALGLNDKQTRKVYKLFMHISRRRCHRPEGSALLEVWAAARVCDPAWGRSVPAGWSDIPELPMESNVADIRSLPEQRMPRRSVRHGARRRRKSSARSLLRLSLRPGKVGNTSGCAASQSFGRPGSPRRRLGRVKNSGSKQDPEFFVPGGGVRVVRPQRPSVGDGAG